MIFTQATAAQKRINFKKDLQSGRLLKFFGSTSPLVSLELQKQKVDGIYISGAVLANDLGYPDIGLTTLTEVTQRGRQIARVTELPSLIDIDTGFGEPMNVARTIQELIELGLSSCHLEDQVNPKRCGHLDGKAVVETQDMILKVKAAVEGKKLDPNFMIMARTDSRSIEGLEKAIDRAKAYVDAGADMIFPEALQDETEFATFRKAIKVPILANMTEFGKSQLLSTKTLQDLGVNIVLYPVTTLRLAMKAVRDNVQKILKDGDQKQVINQMFTRAELYELIRYEEYNQFDQKLFNFKLK